MEPRLWPGFRCFAGVFEGGCGKSAFFWMVFCGELMVICGGVVVPGWLVFGRLIYVTFLKFIFPQGGPPNVSALRRNAGILRCAQDDDFSRGGTRLASLGALALG